MLKNITPRVYQETIFSQATTKNTLVVLPTGLGKTAIAMMLAQHRLQTIPHSKILVIAPTKPLVEQHLNTFKKHFDLDETAFALFTGEITPQKREVLWNAATFIFSTPQGLENDVISDRIALNAVSLLVVDEAHRAVGDYAYAFIAKQYTQKAQYGRILGLTASPGADIQKITEICQNLSIEHIEVKTENDADVKQYLQEVTIDWVKVDLPPAFLHIRTLIDGIYHSRLQEMKNLGYLNSTMIKKTELIQLQGKLHGMISAGDKSPELFKSISLNAEASKIHHALELVETQGITALLRYMEKLIEEGEKGSSKATKNLVADERFRLAYEMTKKLHENNVDHPKLKELKQIVAKNKDKKMIIFSQYRDTASKIKKELEEIGINGVVFVGQAKKADTGMNQKQQKAVLDKFRNNEFHVLIATSVAEEGLDVPHVDMVIFYEPIPSAIRTIQRRGRTGRHSDGQVIILMANKTRDEAYRYVTQNKEKKMHRILGELKQKISLTPVQSQKKLIEDVKIMCDDREKHNGVVKQLVELGVKVDLKRLDVGDYQVSERCSVELKTIPDFVDSIIDGRLLDQLKNLVRVDKPLLILEGTEDIYSQRNLHPNAIRGMLSTIAISYGIPILQTKNNKETAELLIIIAKREQDLSSKNFSMHGSKKPLSDKELQEYIVSSLPSVGPAMAKELLHHFRTVRNVMTASEDDLQKVPGFGEKTAKEIQRTLDKDYYI